MHSITQFAQFLKRSLRRLKDVDKMNHAAKLNGQPFWFDAFYRICSPWNLSLKATEAWKTMKNILFKNDFGYVSYIPFFTKDICMEVTFISQVYCMYMRTLEFTLALGDNCGQFFFSWYNTVPISFVYAKQDKNNCLQILIFLMLQLTKMFN